MTFPLFYELLGYAGSLLVAISLLMRSVLRFRVLNLIGSLVFTIYSLLIQAYPVAVLNGLLVVINIYFLYEIATRKEYFRILEVQPTSDYLAFFLDFYRDDIEQYMPAFRYEAAPNLITFFVLRDTVPAGVFIGRPDEKSGTCQLLLDYVTPHYRDFKTGNYIYHRDREMFRRTGTQRILGASGSAAHRQYLQRMGFTPQPDSDKLVFTLS